MLQRHIISNLQTFRQLFWFYAKDRHDGRAVKDNNVEKRRAGKATGRPRFHNAHESLGIYIYAKPKSQREKNYNDRMREKAEALRCRRDESIVNERYDFFDICAFPLIGKRRKPKGIEKFA